MAGVAGVTGVGFGVFGAGFDRFTMLTASFSPKVEPLAFPSRERGSRMEVEAVVVWRLAAWTQAAPVEWEVASPGSAWPVSLAWKALLIERRRLPLPSHKPATGFTSNSAQRGTSSLTRLRLTTQQSRARRDHLDRDLDDRPVRRMSSPGQAP